ncbi:MAG: hypothetical protein GX671_05775, partial [Clostridiales bacterium]|nr:hypothetical protein [Clostridiales bacterium]
MAKSKDKNNKPGFVRELVDLSLKEMNEMGTISDVCGQFRNLLQDQLNRVSLMADDKREPKNYGELTTITIGICPGDGIGPVIMDQA